MAWEAIAGFTTAGILLVAGLVAWRQLRLTRSSTNAQLMIGFYNRFSTPERIETVRLIYRTEPDKVHKLSRKEIDAIERELDVLDTIGHLVRRDIVDKHLAIDAFAAPPTLRCWYKLREFIDRARDDRGGYYCRGVEYFAKCVLDDQIKNVPVDQWMRFYPGFLIGKPKKLIRELIKDEKRQRRLLSRWALLRAKCKLAKYRRKLVKRRNKKWRKLRRVTNALIQTLR